MNAQASDLDRISAALDVVGRLLQKFIAQDDMEVEHKSPGQPVTEADLAVDRALREMLPAEGEGWLSEETEDDPVRLTCRRVWIVDPIDGTRQFIDGIPEWGVSIGLAVDGEAVAGGFLNPASGLRVVGGVGLGCTANDEPCFVRDGATLEGARVLASRSEYRRGEWRALERKGFTVQPVGSVAHKLALIAAGKADATWSVLHKHEWDVAGGVALIRAAGGVALLPDWTEPRFNQEDPTVDGLFSGGVRRIEAIRELVSEG